MRMSASRSSNFHQLMRPKVEHRFGVSDTHDLLCKYSQLHTNAFHDHDHEHDYHTTTRLQPTRTKGWRFVVTSPWM